MSVVEITVENFEETLEAHELIFIDFWASWCVPCLGFETIYTEVAKENEDIVFGKINVETQSALSDGFNIRSIPHLLVFKYGVVIYSDSGNLPKSGLIDLVKQARQVDRNDLGQHTPDAE